MSFESSRFLLQVGVLCAGGSFSGISMVIPGNGNDDCSLALSFSILASSLARTPAGGTRLFSVSSPSTNSSFGVQEKVKTQ